MEADERAPMRERELQSRDSRDFSARRFFPVAPTYRCRRSRRAWARSSVTVLVVWLGSAAALVREPFSWSGMNRLPVDLEPEGGSWGGANVPWVSRIWK
jgi:hypothetical protein